MLQNIVYALEGAWVCGFSSGQLDQSTGIFSGIHWKSVTSRLQV